MLGCNNADNEDSDKTTWMRSLICHLCAHVSEGTVCGQNYSSCCDVAVLINAFPSYCFFLLFFFVKIYCHKTTTAIIIEISQNKRQLLLVINNSYMKLKYFVAFFYQRF